MLKSIKVSNNNLNMMLHTYKNAFSSVSRLSETIKYSIENDDREYFKTLPVTVKRNAYGRQLGSFHVEQEFKGIGVIPMTFIRAPYIKSVSNGVEILAKEKEHIVAVRYGNQLAMSFHPELDEDERIHKYFVKIVSDKFAKKILD